MFKVVLPFFIGPPVMKELIFWDCQHLSHPVLQKSALRYLVDFSMISGLASLSLTVGNEVTGFGLDSLSSLKVLKVIAFCLDVLS